MSRYLTILVLTASLLACAPARVGLPGKFSLGSGKTTELYHKNQKLGDVSFHAVAPSGYYAIYETAEGAFLFLVQTPKQPIPLNLPEKIRAVVWKENERMAMIEHEGDQEASVVMLLSTKSSKAAASER